ncbi:MAG: hypothetical protein U0872_08240 [Planctomycetaceae bacterium]
MSVADGKTFSVLHLHHRAGGSGREIEQARSFKSSQAWTVILTLPFNIWQVKTTIFHHLQHINISWFVKEFDQGG